MSGMIAAALEPPAPGEPITTELVTIARFEEPYFASIAQCKLESEGIPAFVADRNTIGMNWLYSNAIGGAKLIVRDFDVEQARQILLAGRQKGELRLEIADTPEEIHCPACDSVEVGYQRFSRKYFFLSLLLLGLPLPFLKRKWHCDHCGHEWKRSLL